MEFFFDVNSTTYLLFLFIMGGLTGFVGAMGAGGGLIILPFMIASGVPPAIALGSARCAGIGAWLVALRNFNKDSQINWKRLPIITAITVTGGVIGTYIIIDIDEKYIYPIVGTLLIFIAPIILLKKDFGLHSKIMSNKSTVFGYILLFIVMIYSGFFGAGSSILSIFVMGSFLGFKTLEAHATEMAAWIIMSIVSTAIFILHDKVDYTYMLVILISMSIGTYIGSKCAIKMGNLWIKRVVCAFALIMGVKMILESVL